MANFSTFCQGQQTREEAGEACFQQILDLMEHGNSQVLTKDHAVAIAQWALKIASDYC